MASDAKFKTYDKFKEYIRDEVAKGKNRKITVEPFNDMAEGTDTHLKIRLFNVTSGSGSLYKKVEEFDDGVKLRSEKSVQNGSDKYYAYVPWTTKKKKKKKYSSDDDDKPSIVMPLVYCMALCATLTIASLTTTWEQWTTLI